MQFSMTRVSSLRQFRILSSAFLLSVFWISGQAQTTFVRISVVSFNPAKVHVELYCTGASQWSFRNTHASIVDLAERIENFQGSQVGEVSLKRLVPGEFRFSEPVTRVSYDVRLTRPTNLGHRSRVSWLNEDYGLLLLRDLLPEVGMGPAPLLNLNFALPPEWAIASSRDAVGPAQYVVTRPERAAFLIGRQLHIDQKIVGDTKIRVATGGNWPVRGKALTQIVGKIVAEHARAIGHSPPTSIALLLMPFETAIGPERWSAETTGENVVLAMGRHAQEKALVARLQVVLDHELFHLWIPNSIGLKGDYDWFFEGFTLYQALLTGLRLKHIKFDDYLDTLGRVYASYRSATERDKLSLLEASERRWTTASPLVYDKGMLVALVYDLMLRRKSHGRESLTEIYPVIMRESAGGGKDANELVMRVLDGRTGLEGFSEQYVQSASEIDLKGILAPFGLEVTNLGSVSRITVGKNLNREQRQFLKALGYEG
jgi:predicted metalloprotease with PDZ domain